MDERLLTDPDVPGLVHPVAKVVAETRIGAHRFQKLEDGTVLMSQWSGALNDERMVSHALFEEEDVAALATVFG